MVCVIMLSMACRAELHAMLTSSGCTTARMVDVCYLQVALIYHDRAHGVGAVSSVECEAAVALTATALTSTD